MPLGVAILTFFGVELLVALTIQNLEVGFFPAVIIAGISYWMIAQREQTTHESLDSPAIETYDLPVTQAYAIVKKTLKNFSYGDREWKIPYDEKSSYSLTAISKWKDYSFKDNKIVVPEGYLSRKVILQVALRRNSKTKLTELGMKWTIESAMGRGECNELQAYTTEAIREALKEVESGRRKFTDWENS